VTNNLYPESLPNSKLESTSARRLRSRKRKNEERDMKMSAEMVRNSRTAELTHDFAIFCLQPLAPQYFGGVRRGYDVIKLFKINALNGRSKKN
jgi:hypothetical protein